MNNPNSDEKLVNFLKQYRPNLSEAAPDLEVKLLAAIDRNEEGSKKQDYWGKVRSIVSTNRFIPSFRQWNLPPTIVAMLIVFWSGYRLIVPGQFNPDEGAHLEAFLVNNWEDVLHDSRIENMSEMSQTDLFNPSVSANSEQRTNN